ncbi:MAG: single-stranded-DNA-specific exonuclease RecJ [Alphaproteobacteria bacterium]|nr:single-stranded-DNA-specific exonuclease RecJ [Alphaproteobacteria bacterium]
MRKIVERSMQGRAWITAGDQDLPFVGEEDLLRRILAGRGIAEQDFNKFLNPSVKEYMPDPFVLRDMQTAVRVISDSIIAHEKIAVYGDYDVDGITSTAIFVKYLRALGVDVIWHLPTREGEGYGLNVDAVRELHDAGAETLITVDCGISGNAEVEMAKSLGMRVVITDHHSPDSVIPDADAVVNPKRIDDESGLNYLAGVGVAFLTLVALNRELKNRNLSEFSEKLKSINLLNLLDCVALGTICDTMALVGLNRAFVATGLKVMDLRHNLGLKTLMDVAKVKKMSVYAAGFVLGPRLNAAGRLDSASPALELLLTDNPLIAYDLATKLDAMNQERINIQNAIMIQATDLADECCRRGNCSLFICGDNWHGGVMGIIAGRLKDRYNLPTCVATRSDGVVNGSGRSVPGVDLGAIIHDALALGLVSEGGGHAAAAGFSLHTDQEKAFCDFLEKSVLEQLGGEKPVPDIIVDAQMDAAGATMKLINVLKQMEPFGQGNQEPVLVLRGAVLHHVSVMGHGGTHLRGDFITSSGSRLSFVGFNLVGTPVGNFLLDDANINTKMMLLGRLKENDYNGRVSAQFILEDIAV